MSGPTWLPPKQPEPARAPQGRLLSRGAPGPPPAHGAALQPHPRVNFCPLPSEQCYQPPGGPEDRGPAWVGSHGPPQCSQGLPPDRGCLRPASLDAEIDSLTSMLAELDGGRGHAPQRPDRQVTACPVLLTLFLSVFSVPTHPPSPLAFSVRGDHTSIGEQKLTGGLDLAKIRCFPGACTWHGLAHMWEVEWALLTVCASLLRLMSPLRYLPIAQAP